jgi:hypothetical protein
MAIELTYAIEATGSRRPGGGHGVGVFYVLLVRCCGRLWYFYRAIFFLSIMLEWYVLRKTVKYTNFTNGNKRYVVHMKFYLFRVNLSTYRYVSHPVYWEAMEIGK